MRYPATPLPESCLSVPREAGDRGVADKEYMVDVNGNIVDVVMQNYLRAQAKLETAWKQDLESRLGTTLVTEATMLQREGIHNHCRSCVVSSCTLGKLFDPALWRESCPIGDCPWNCGVRFHMCKANDHASICPNYRPPDALDWLRRLGGADQAAQEEEEENSGQEAKKYSVTAEARGESPPSEPYHLQDPTYLSVTQEHLHPLQPAPSNIRSFVCAKVFRRDEIAAHLATVHQTIVPGLNSSWLQLRCPLAWLGCSWATSRQAPFSKEFCLKFSRSNDSFSVAQVEPASARETGFKEERRREEKQKESKKVVGRQKGEKCSLALLPTETLHHLFSFLQPIDLRAVAQTCSRLSEVCDSLFPYRGCVAPVWERRRGVGQRRMRYNWIQASTKWSFSASIGCVDHWQDVGEGEVQRHLAHCRFYQMAECRQEAPMMPGLKEQLEKRVALKKSSQWFIQ